MCLLIADNPASKHCRSLSCPRTILVPNDTRSALKFHTSLTLGNLLTDSKCLSSLWISRSSIMNLNLPTKPIRFTVPVL
ncbi:hypothetical protein Plhal304r1_c006g0024411 [Plasmopara halstedii]